MELKQSRTFARLWYLFVALWQAVQSAILIFCLVSNTWIVSIDSIFSKGLFEKCLPENLTCVTSDICSNCTGYNSTIICQKPENKTESVDEEFVGGLLVTKIMFRGIVGFISICLFFIDENRGKDFRVEFPKALTVFEEFCGVCDVAIVGLFLLVNDEYLSANSCSKLGIAFWLNFIRPLTAFIVLRFLFPSTRACARRCFAKKPPDDTDQEKNPSTDLKLTFQNEEQPGTSNEPATLNYNTDQQRKPSVDLQPTFQNGEQPTASNEPAAQDSKTDMERISSSEQQPTFDMEQPGTSNEPAKQDSSTDQERKRSTDLQSTFQNGEQSGTLQDSEDSKTDLERMSSTEEQPTFQREHPDTPNEPATPVSNTGMEEKPSTDLQSTLQNREQPGTSNEPAAQHSKTDLKQMSSAEQQPTFQREHPDTPNETANPVSNTDMEQKPVSDVKSISQNGEQSDTSNETTERDDKTDLEQKPSMDSQPIYLSEEQTGTSNEPVARDSINTEQERKIPIDPQSTCQNDEHPVTSNESEIQVTEL